MRVNSAVLRNSGIKSAEQGNFSAEQRNSSGIASPTEIRIITTRLGAEKAQRTLLSGDPGWFHRLRADYGLPEIAFGVENIRVVTGPDGTPLDDILGQADNAAVADFTTEEVRVLTADPNASPHVSIAGGRKTMGFYLA